MNIVPGSNVDLISPFPLTEARRVYGWTFCYRTMPDSDLLPRSAEGLTQHIIDNVLSPNLSWGIIDKHKQTTDKHEAPLVGLVFTEVINNGYAAFLHFACGRKAFKLGLVEEAFDLAASSLFTTYSDLLRVGGYVDEKNAPAKSLLRKLGYKFEGVCEASVSWKGEARNFAYYGLTRSRWESLHPTELPINTSDTESELSTEHADTYEYRPRRRAGHAGAGSATGGDELSAVPDGESTAGEYSTVLEPPATDLALDYGTTL